MRRLRLRDPSGLCRACGGSIPYTVSYQKRTLIEKAPAGVDLRSRHRRRTKRDRQVTFDLPEIVLDLDAEDNPHVRPFNEEDAAQQRAKWGYSPIIPEVEQRVAELQKNIRQDGDKMRHIQAARQHHYKISDLDVLSVALLGGNATASSPVDREAVDDKIDRRDIFLKGRDRAMHANGIPERILAGDANTIIHFLLHRQRLTSIPPEADSASTSTFEGAVQKCNTLWTLQRVCSHSLSSGHEAISRTSMDAIARWFRNQKPVASETYNQDALKFVNNLTMRQLSANADLSPSLSLVGLVLAANLGLLPAIIQYLHICLSQGFIGKSQDKPETISAIGEGILKALEEGQGSARGTRPELFTLLTGRTLAGSTVQPALFGSRLSSGEEDPHTHHIYVQLLSQLGAYRLLWHLWKTVAIEKMRQYEAFYYAAFIRCAEVLHGAKSVAELDCTTATGDLERDAELDLQAINALDAHYASSTSSEDPYAVSIENPLPWNEIKGAFQSSDINQAAARINDLINSV